MQQICLKFRDYRYDHPNLTAEGVTRRSVAEYVSTGILSSNDATYIREHNIVFHGFDPSKIAGDVPVLEAIYSNGHLQKRIVGYSNASVVTYDLQKTNLP